jgi:hypothetical protein
MAKDRIMHVALHAFHEKVCAGDDAATEGAEAAEQDAAGKAQAGDGGRPGRHHVLGAGRPGATNRLARRAIGRALDCAFSPLKVARDGRVNRPLHTRATFLPPKQPVLAAFRPEALLPLGAVRSQPLRKLPPCCPSLWITFFRSQPARPQPPRLTGRLLAGCKCKHSRCTKKCCECFEFGVPCSAKCVCVDCENGKPPQVRGVRGEMSGLVSVHSQPGKAFPCRTLFGLGCPMGMDC